MEVGPFTADGPADPFCVGSVDCGDFSCSKSGRRSGWGSEDTVDCIVLSAFSRSRMREQRCSMRSWSCSVFARINLKRIRYTSGGVNGIRTGSLYRSSETLQRYVNVHSRRIYSPTVRTYCTTASADAFLARNLARQVKVATIVNWRAYILVAAQFQSSAF